MRCLDTQAWLIISVDYDAGCLLGFYGWEVLVYASFVVFLLVENVFINDISVNICVAPFPHHDLRACPFLFLVMLAMHNALMLGVMRVVSQYMSQD